MKHYLWIFVLSGLWLIIGPFVLGYSVDAAALWSNILVGVIISVVAIFGYTHKEEN